MEITLNRNVEHNGIELLFDGKPSVSVRNALKSNGFRWHGVKKLWYARETEARLNFANQLAGNKLEVREENHTKKQVANKYGVKVGDVFHQSWGYNMTINTFYQVISVTASSVRVIEVEPEILKDECQGYCGDILFKNPNGEMLPKATGYTSFIKNQETGDLKRVYHNEINNMTTISLGNHNAYLMTDNDWESPFYENHMD